MKTPKRILFLDQEIHPFLGDETPIRLLNRQLPEYFQKHGYETRIIMPKFGEINERRHQLHDVIRLSGMNIEIDDKDHPTLIKSMSMQKERLQVYFIDNEEYFGKRKGIGDENGEYADNDERAIFYTRGALEIIREQSWCPDIVWCSGWMASLAPIYLKHKYGELPMFKKAKIVLVIDDNTYEKPFGTKFAEKILTDGVTHTDVKTIAGFPVGHEELMRLAIENADEVIYTTDKVNPRLMNFAQTKGKPIHIMNNEDVTKYFDFLDSLREPAAE